MNRLLDCIFCADMVLQVNVHSLTTMITQCTPYLLGYHIPFLLSGFVDQSPLRSLSSSLSPIKRRETAAALYAHRSEARNADPALPAVKPRLLPSIAFRVAYAGRYGSRTSGESWSIMRGRG